MRKKFKKMFGMDEQKKENSNNEQNGQQQDMSTSINQDVNTDTQLVIRKPKNFEQAQETARCIINRNPVFLDLKSIDDDMTVRILDFLSGVIFTLDGDIRPMAPKMYLLTPPNVNIDGLEALIGE